MDTLSKKQLIKIATLNILMSIKNNKKLYSTYSHLIINLTDHFSNQQKTFNPAGLNLIYSYGKLPPISKWFNTFPDP